MGDEPVIRFLCATKGASGIASFFDSLSGLHHTLPLPLFHSA